MAFVLSVLGVATVLSFAEGSGAVGEGYDLLERGETHAAVALLEAWLADGGRDAPAAARLEALVVLAQARRELEDPEAAVADLDRALALAGSAGVPSAAASQVPLLLAEAHLEMHDARGALEALRVLGAAAAPAAAPPDLSYLLGSAYAQAGDAEKATAHFEAAAGASAAASATRGRAQHALGVLLFDRGAYEAALERFARGPSSAAEGYYTRVYRARALLRLGRYDEALAALSDAAPTTEAKYLRGLAHTRSGQLEPAEKELQSALLDNPSSIEALCALGEVLRRQGKREAARRVVSRLSDARRRWQELTKRQAALAQLAHRRPDDPQVEERLARLALEAGDVEGAEGHAWRALRLGRGRLSSRLALAEVLKASGRFRAAAVQYRKVLAADPAHREARAELEELVRKHSRAPR